MLDADQSNYVIDVREVELCPPDDRVSALGGGELKGVTILLGESTIASQSSYMPFRGRAWRGRQNGDNTTVLRNRADGLVVEVSVTARKRATVRMGGD